MANMNNRRPVPDVELRYIPRSGSLEPRIRLTIFRSGGCAFLDIRTSAIAAICDVRSEAKADVLHAFRASVPSLCAELNAIIAGVPDGGVRFIGADDIAAPHQAAA
jgi:hypothetical protein